MIGGPNSLRPSDRRFRPPSSTVPPSGTSTAVCIVIELKIGCCKNSVTRVGAPTAPTPWKIGWMGTTIVIRADVEAARAGRRQLALEDEGRHAQAEAGGVQRDVQVAGEHAARAGPGEEVREVRVVDEPRRLELAGQQQRLVLPRQPVGLDLQV